MKDFKRLKVWQQGMEITLLCYELVRAFPKEEKYGLISQITRSASSIQRI
jgi:four helix bundle protein